MQKKSRKKLYLLYIDFEKVYDKVPRKNSFRRTVKYIGCGQLLLRTVSAIYFCTKLILKSAIITATYRARQGAATSIFLFVIYIDRLVEMLKGDLDNDDYLGSLHILLLMDDAILLATSKDSMCKKLKIVQSYCEIYGMTMNMKKTKFMVI